MEAGTRDFPDAGKRRGVAAGRGACSTAGWSKACSSAAISSRSPPREGVAWSDLEPLVLETLLDHFVSGAPLFDAGTAAGIHVAADEDYGEDPADADIVDQIKELIETRVRPAVAQDGGDIVYRGYRDGTLFVAHAGRLRRLPELDRSP